MILETVTAILEPSTFAVLGLALLGFSGASRRKR
ncbi:PEP-CTERM sorting domain-containing protein [Psychromonas sp. SR45-3]|nr:PEP-CTERM sorting domain-containing protein [Psychromonas sp. SR45-3]MBB1274496.1 PEP-CTERM sorting domain-containing protein [Psychromonas sp. SR45-3]